MDFNDISAAVVYYFFLKEWLVTFSAAGTFQTMQCKAYKQPFINRLKHTYDGL